MADNPFEEKSEHNPFQDPSVQETGGARGDGFDSPFDPPAAAPATPAAMPSPSKPGAYDRAPAPSSTFGAYDTGAYGGDGGSAYSRSGSLRVRRAWPQNPRSRDSFPPPSSPEPPREPPATRRYPRLSRQISARAVAVVTPTPQVFATQPWRRPALHARSLTPSRLSQRARAGPLRVRRHLGARARPRGARACARASRGGSRPSRGCASRLVPPKELSLPGRVRLRAPRHRRRDPRGFPPPLKLAHYSFILLVVCLFYNFFFCATAAMFSFGAVTGWMMAAVYLLCGVPGAYSLWYRRLYSACKNDSALSYLWFFVVYLGHIAFCLYAFIGMTGTKYSLAGVSSTSQAMAKSGAVGGVYAFGTALFGVDMVLSVYALRMVYARFRGVGIPFGTRGTRRCVRAFAPAPPTPCEGRENKRPSTRAARGTAIIDSIASPLCMKYVRATDATRRDPTRDVCSLAASHVSRSLPRSSRRRSARSAREQISVPLVVVVLLGVFVHIRLVLEEPLELRHLLLVREVRIQPRL